MMLSFDVEKYSKDKKTIADNIGYMVFNLMQSAFKWGGLPDTIPQKWLEFMLMRDGYTVVTEVNGKLYAFNGGLGGQLDEYYQPTLAIIANPYLNYSGSVVVKDDKDGVLGSNDTLRRGLIPLVGKYAGLLAENTITMRIADINARTTTILSGSDESTISSIKEYYRQLEKGNLGAIQESTFLEDLKVQSAAATAGNQLTDLIEMEQYLKASLFNMLGLQSNYNMKRESINSNEAQLNEDSLRPFIYNMLVCRKDFVERLNKRYNLNVTVELNTVWKEKEVSDDGNSRQSDPGNGVPGNGDSGESETEKNGGVDSSD